jgi:hypothetical protein
MTSIRNKIFSFKRILLIVGLTLFGLIWQLKAMAQEQPPRPISCSCTQNLSFGAFFQAISGGTVIIFPDGSRSVTGDVIQANLGFLYFPAIFEITANRGTLITVVNGSDVTLTGSNGGSMVMHIGTSLPGSPFITTVSPPTKTQVKVGGTLTVGTPLANPAGSYSGTFQVTFNQN